MKRSRLLTANEAIDILEGTTVSGHVVEVKLPDLSHKTSSKRRKKVPTEITRPQLRYNTMGVTTTVDAKKISEAITNIYRSEEEEVDRAVYTLRRVVSKEDLEKKYERLFKMVNK